jgi:hypothetical protein
MEEGRAPGGLWVLPIFLGVVGGVIAMIISNIAYHKSGWEYLIISILITILAYLGLSLLFINLLPTIHF